MLQQQLGDFKVTAGDGRIEGMAARGVIVQIAKPFKLGTLLAAVRGAARPRQRGAA